MCSAEDRELICRLQVPSHDRNLQDLSFIYARLRSIEGLGRVREPALRELCRCVRHEKQNSDHVLFKRGDACTSWYILLTGSVLIDGSTMYLPRNCFGTRVNNSPTRQNDCLILESTDLIVIDYTDAPDPEATIRRQSTARALGGPKPKPPPRDGAVLSVVPPQPNNKMPEPATLAPPTTPMSGKRSSHASDTSSAYSGSDMMSNELDSGQSLPRRGSFADSDDEDFETSSHETQSLRDVFWDCLLRDPTERTDEDVEILMESVQNLPAFSSLALTTRRALCAVMVIAIVKDADQVVMTDGELLDTWSVVLNGVIEVRTPDGTVRELTRGDSFGVRPSPEPQYHKGSMRTMSEDCQFACVPQANFVAIMSREKNLKSAVEEGGRTVLVYEERDIEGGRKARVVNKGTPEKLICQLMEDTTCVDAMFTEDLLLTYRTFLDSGQPIAERLLSWYREDRLSAKVKRCLLLWVNNHFNDFETSPPMMRFLDAFETMLDKEKATDGERRLFHLACSTKAKPRHITLDLSHLPQVCPSGGAPPHHTKSLPFLVEGGKDGWPIYVTQVIPFCEAEEAGLRRGDQLMAINGRSCDRLSRAQAVDILQRASQADLVVLYDPLHYHEMLHCVERVVRSRGDTVSSGEPADKHHRDKGKRKPGGSMSSSISVPDGNFYTSNSQPPKSPGTNTNANNRCRSAHNSPSRGGPGTPAASTKHQHPPIQRNPQHKSTSHPDLAALGKAPSREPEDTTPDQVVRVWRSTDNGNQHTWKFIPVHRSTTSQEVVLQAMREFGVPDDLWEGFALYQVTVTAGPLVKQRRLQDTMEDLAGKAELNTRYYLKHIANQEALVSDDTANEILKESKVTLLQLSPQEVATRLTLDDYEVFRSVEATEYVDEVFETGSHPGMDKFTALVKRETFWAASELCAETNLAKRVRLLKCFIKIAKLCKELKNFNTLFCIVNGLSLQPVDRLKQTWERLPNKYMKLFSDLGSVIDPSRNFCRYRSLLSPENCQPPMIPFLPLVKKDLTFIHLGNETRTDDGLVNFEKLRMLAKEVRSVCRMCNVEYDLASMQRLAGGGIADLPVRPSSMSSGTQNGAQEGYAASVSSGGSGANLSSGVATLKRSSKRRSGVLNTKKAWEEWTMRTRVRTYMTQVEVIEDPEKLSQLSYQMEAGGQNSFNSNSNLSGSSGVSSTRRSGSVGSEDSLSAPKFGASSVEDSRKLLSLSEGAKRCSQRQLYLPPRAVQLETLVHRPLSTRSAVSVHGRPAVQMPSISDGGSTHSSNSGGSVISQKSDPPPYHVAVAIAHCTKPQHPPHPPPPANTVKAPKPPPYPTGTPQMGNRPPPPAYHDAIQSRTGSKPAPPPPPRTVTMTTGQSAPLANKMPNAAR